MAPSKQLAKESFDRIVVLAVNGSEAELNGLRRLFAGSHWVLSTARTIAEAGKLLDQSTPAVVLCASQLPDGDWKDMLSVTAAMDPYPNVVVTSHLADDRLWSEALNQGAYDVQVLPADATEFFRILSCAWRNWDRRCTNRRGNVYSLACIG